MPHKPLSSRPLDALYLIFFLTHIPVMLCVDLTPLYPSFVHATFPFLNHIRAWYVATYRDRFFVAPPSWFRMFLWMEAGVHLPVSLWMVGGIVRDDPKVPILLLPFATQVAITTSVCIAEYFSWDDFSSSERVALGQLYIPYLALALFMGWDAYRRLVARLDGAGAKGVDGKKIR